MIMTFIKFDLNLTKFIECAILCSSLELEVVLSHSGVISKNFEKREIALKCLRIASNSSEEDIT